MKAAVSEALLLYDGACGLCAASVQFILRHERQHTLRFAPLQGERAAAVRARHPELEGVDSMVWVQGDRVKVRTDAVIEAARYLGFPWALAVGARLIPRPLRDPFYGFVARHRHKIFTGPEQCYLPPPEVRARFLP